ncbi:MAG TPA: hypothetical protein ENN99_04445 [Chloroflexi bacterium]|nr:hypothetical protein [Chloroflexota bacterium]
MSVLTGQKLVNPMGLQTLNQYEPMPPPPLDVDSLPLGGQTDYDDVETIEGGAGLSERNRRVLVILLAVVLGGVALTLIGLTLTQGSWWYTAQINPSVIRIAPAWKRCEIKWSAAVGWPT